MVEWTFYLKKSSLKSNKMLWFLRLKYIIFFYDFFLLRTSDLDVFKSRLLNCILICCTRHRNINLKKGGHHARTIRYEREKINEWQHKHDVLVWFMVFNDTFSNISAISWRSVLLVEQTGVPAENHRPTTSHWQTLSHNVVSSTLHHERSVQKAGLSI